MKSIAIIKILLIFSACCYTFLRSQTISKEEIRVVLNSGGWQLVGDMLLPASPEKAPAVLMLNKAAGDRQIYKELASQLFKRGIASLRLDLRGHGESVNLGKFIPGGSDSMIRKLIWDSDIDVASAHRFLKMHPRIESERIGIVGASYSGEEMAEAGRKTGYAKAYVALSPGSLSDESIAVMDTTATSWLFVVSRNERYLHEIEELVQKSTRSVEMIYVPGDKHATRILEARPDMSERIAVWLAMKLKE